MYCNSAGLEGTERWIFGLAFAKRTTQSSAKVAINFFEGLPIDNSSNRFLFNDYFVLRTTPFALDDRRETFDIKSCKVLRIQLFLNDVRDRERFVRRLKIEADLLATQKLKEIGQLSIFEHP
jgi:hypothetical protein